MNVNLTLHLILALYLGAYQTSGQDDRHVERRARPNSQRRFNKPCLVIVAEKDYEDNRKEEQPLLCEIRGEDRHGANLRFVRIKGLKTSWARRNNIISGSTTFFAQNAVIDDEKNEIIFPAGEVVQLGSVSGSMTNSFRDLTESSYEDKKRKLMTGTKSVLVIRAVAADKETTASESQLSNDIFGTFGDSVTLKSQFSACSDGKLQFKPLTSNRLVGSDGVYTVKLPTTFVSNVADGSIRDAMVSKAQSDLGAPLDQVADYVMLCLPPGTPGGWAAYAFINHWLSVFNDDNCRHVFVQVHEIGHNLNLGHSNEGTEEYGDGSSVMGHGWADKMCFNGAETYQLGWYSQYHVDLPNNGSFNWNGNLVGFAEKSSATSDDKMIVRIITSTTDIYVHFNRKIGMNSDTLEGEDQVLVVTRKTGVDHSENSNLVSKMATNDVYTIPDFDGSSNSLEIRVISITTTTVPGRAEISIQFDAPPAPVSSPDFTSEETPVFSPVVTPTTEFPTEFPTAKLTEFPTEFPTDFPTEFPTEFPTPLPTSPPTRRRTKAPSPAPTKKIPNRRCNFNSLCELGEDCMTCPNDCNGKRNFYCCIGGKKCRKNKCDHSGRFCAVY